MWIIQASLKNPYAVAVLALVIMVLGAVSLSTIPVDILPVFRAPAVQVITFYSGMPTGSVEKTITNRIERWTNQSNGCKLVESKSMLGVSIVRLYFRDDVDPSGALTQVSSLALSQLPTLPPNTLPPVALPFDPTATLPLGVITVSGDDYDEAHLQDIAHIELRNMLGGYQGVVAPAVFGGKQRTILIYVNPDQLEARKLSTGDVVEALSRSNLMVTPGVARFGKNEYQLDSNAMVGKVEELNDIPIKFQKGKAIYLRDIGRAVDGNAIQTGLVRIDGKRQVYVPVYRQQGASTLAVIDGVRGGLRDMESKLPPGVKLDLVMDQSEYVRHAIEALLHEGVIGALLVSVMILIFLGNLRMTAIATMSIPLAILCAIIGLTITGNTINAMTLGGLALAIGPLVDDAIVELENNHRHSLMGKTRLRAAFDSATEVMLPVFVATSTTIIVLCPMALMPGIGGFLFRPLTLAVAFAMLGSFLLSRTFVPALCAWWLPPHVHGAEHASLGLGARLYQRIDRFLTFLTQKYERLLLAALRNRILVLTLVGLLFVGAMSLLPLIGREFFPQVDAGQIIIYMRSPSGVNIDESERRVAQVERVIQELIPVHERRKIVSELGVVPNWSSAYTPNSGTQDTVVKIQLSEERSLSAQEYAIKLRHGFEADPELEDLRFSFDTGGMVSAALNYGATSPIDVQIVGGKLEVAMRLAQDIRDRVRKIRGAADVRILQRLDAPQRIIVVDRQLAAEVGLTEQDVMNQVATAMNSSVSINRNFWIDTKTGNQYFVAVQYPEDPKMLMQDVLNIVATGTNSKYPVKLGDMIRLDYGSAPIEVNHVSLARTLNVLVNTEGRDLGGVASDIAEVVPELKSPPAGMRVTLKGEYARMNESFGNLGWGFALAALLVYLLLVALFRSFLGPFIIMFAVPLGLIGVLLTLFLTNTTLNVQSSMGIIFMVGIVVANSVLLVDFANKQRKKGLSLHQAIVTAATIRFRPILMTFLATFLDLLPMAIGIGRGSEANVPLGRAVVGGLLTSTFLTLIVVPILYTLLNSETLPPEVDVDRELLGPARLEHQGDEAAPATPALLHGERGA